MIMAASGGKLGLLHHPSLPRALSAFADMAELKVAHAHLVVTGDHRSPATLSRLLAFTAISPAGHLRYAEAIFDQVDYPSRTMYNTMIRAFSQGNDPGQSVVLYLRMRRARVWPDNFTFPFLFGPCLALSLINLGRGLHGHVVKLGLDRDVYVVNSMISMYAGFKKMRCAHTLFHQSFGFVDVVSWTAMLSGYASTGDLCLARHFFDRMPLRNEVSWNAMIGGYAAAGDVDTVQRLFDEMPARGVVTWSCLVSGFLHCGLCSRSLAVFKQMVSAGIQPNNSALVSAVTACAQMKALEEGEKLHDYVLQLNRELDVTLGTAIVNMYGKCGSIGRAIQVFVRMPIKNLLSWNTMLAGLAVSGYGRQALMLFWRLRMVGLEPNASTFVGVLSACSHSGLVDEGSRLFDLMTRGFAIKPQAEHYGCMVDLLGRAGLIKETLEFVETMPVDPHPGLLGALAGACRVHGEVELGEQLGKQLIELEPHHGGRYMLLSNIYAAAKRWDDVALVRNLLKERSVHKTAGNSAVEAEFIRAAAS